MLEIAKPLTLNRALNAVHGDVGSLLERLLIEVTAANYRYFLHELIDVTSNNHASPERWCWPPLLANERQVSGLFAQALSTVCPVSRPEVGITRQRAKEVDDKKSGGKDPNGRIDFYASFGRRSVALELKRVSIATVRKAGSSAGFKKQWAAVSNQASEALKHMRGEPASHPYAASIGLLVIRVGRMVTKLREVDVEQTGASARFDEMVAEVLKAIHPHFLAAYRPPREMQAITGWGPSGDKVRIFPGIIFAASVRVRAR